VLNVGNMKGEVIHQRHSVGTRKWVIQGTRLISRCKYLQEVGCGCEDWIGLAQDRDRWRALVSAVRNLWVL
jgi:hypothetical protein